MLKAIISMALLSALRPPDNALAAQNGPPAAPVPQSSSLSDTLILSAQSDHILGASQGGSGSFQWMHSTQKRVIFVVGATTQVLGQTRWTLGLGDVVWFHSRWTFETSVRAGSGSAPGQSFQHRVINATVTYAVTPHLSLNLNEEFVDIATSRGSLLKGGVCLCNIRRYSTTLSAAHSAFGNLATEFFSVREETANRLVAPFFEFTGGRTLPTLINPALNLTSPSAGLLSFAGGARLLPLHRRGFTLAASYARSGPSETLSFGVSMSVKLRGD